MRFDLYTLIHKAQRFHLFRLSEEIGTADFSRIAETVAIAKQVLELMGHLKDHAQNEKNYIHPLFKAVSSIGDHFDEEHENLDAEIKKVEWVVKEKSWSDLYSTFARFLGVYLLHLDEEEAAQRDILWKHYADNELGAIFERFRSERPPLMAKADFEFMLPALSVPELTQLFRGMKSSAPPTVFQGACDTAARILDKNRWEKIAAELA